MPNKFLSFNDAINLFAKIMCSGCEFEGVLSGCETTGCQVKREIIEIVNKHPPADVVEVVRCKDCVNAKKGEPGSLFPICIRLNQLTSNNFYCACGERRTE